MICRAVTKVGITSLWDIQVLTAVLTGTGNRVTGVRGPLWCACAPSALAGTVLSIPAARTV